MSHDLHGDGRWLLLRQNTYNTFTGDNGNIVVMSTGPLQ